MSLCGTRPTAGRHSNDPGPDNPEQESQARAVPARGHARPGKSAAALPPRNLAAPASRPSLRSRDKAQTARTARAWCAASAASADLAGATDLSGSLVWNLTNYRLSAHDP